MGYGLGVCCDAVVLGGGEVDMLGFEAGEDVLDFVEAFLGGAVLDDYLEEIISLTRRKQSGDCSPMAGREDRRWGRGGSGS